MKLHPITGRRPGRHALLAVAWLAVSLVGVAGADSGRVLVLEDIVVAPDDPDVVALARRHVSVMPGDPVDTAVLAEVRADLEGSGYFREVDLYTARGHEPGRVILHVEVALDRKLRFLTGFGYEPLDGWYLNLIGARLLNRPRPGAEWRLAVRDGYFIDGLYLEGRLNTGRRGQDAWLVDLHARSEIWFAYEGREGWRQMIQTASVRLGRRVATGGRSHWTGWLGYRGVDPGATLETHFENDEQERPASDLIDADLATRDYLDVWLEGEWDGRDPVRPWRRGAWLGTRLRLGTDLDRRVFPTFEVDARRTVPVGDAAALAGRLRAGYAGPDTPYHDRFRFGGVYSVRGYDFSHLSGPLGASQFLQANLEYRAALLDREAPTPKVTGLVFVDTGQSWDRHGRSLGWVAGAGVGFRLRLPWVRLVGVEVGYPLVDTGDLSPFVVNVALGWSY
ncbi:BamA/TamA family outer membrane protein [bacterium]|nr:BamA/TamA family outer membrane protein [bacterium]